MPKITFLNQPKLSEHDTNTLYEKRLKLLPEIENFISNHKRFEGEDIAVSFAEKGASSLVGIIETRKEKLALKVRIDAPLAETEFLEAWGLVGVKVPHIYESGMLGDKMYILMEYINEKTLREEYRKGEMVKKAVYIEMGKTLRLMHQVKGQGYGRPVDNKGEYTDFASWLTNTLEKKVVNVKENGLLSDDLHGSLPLALKTSILFTKTNKESVYCHNDFSYVNIFSTTPLTVFDPRPMFNNPYLDLALTIVIAIGNSGHKEASIQLIDGYFGHDSNVNQKALQANILVQSYLKFPHWSKVRKLEGIRFVQNYLAETKHLLGS
ncbi:MAG: hypothetical protein NUV54_03375 [Candidatus Taylorbacteria bacterium]|nr:hypothetical protein [Candidatus Taylorbacteria bacterium]